MKITKFSTTLLLIGIMFLPILAAANPTITENSVKLTADYSKFSDEDDDFIVVATESFTIDNSNGNDTPIKIKVIGLPSSKYKVQPDVKDVTAANGTTTTTLTLEIPHDKSPGEEKIGTIQITDANNTVLDSAELIQKTIPMLDLVELEVKSVDSAGKTQKDEFTAEEGTYALENEVKPYTDLSFTFNLRNLFDRDYQNQGKLEEIELALELDDDELLKEGYEDTYSIENIEAGKEIKFTMALPINEEVEPGSYTIEFTITAEDGEGVEYEIKKELDLEIELDDDDIRIIKTQIVPETASVCDKEVSLDVNVHNFGSDDQDKVKVTLSNAELNLDEKIENIAIDSHTEDDDSWQKMFTINVEDSKVKTYFLDLKAYLGSTLTDAEVVQLELKPCAEETAAKAEETEKEQETNPPLAETKKTAEKTSAAQEKITGNVVKSIEKAPYTPNDYLIALMLIAITVVAAMTVLMLIILFKEKS